MKIWPFFSFRNLAFFETTYGLFIGLFYFLGPGNPVLNNVAERGVET